MQLTRRSTPERSPLSRPGRAALAIVALALVGLLAAMLPAQARQVYPSKKQVATARAAAGAKAAAVKSIQAKLVAADNALQAAQDAAEVAAEKYNGALIILQQRTQESRAASTAATRATRKAGIAQVQIGKLAADAYMNGGMGNLAALIGAGGPEQVLDRAAGLQIVGGIRQRTLSDATRSKAVAGILQHEASVALARQEAAAAALASAKSAAEAQAASAQRQAQSIAASRAKLVVQLAHLQRISVNLAKQRQAGIAKARAEAAARAARLAAERAAAAAAANHQGGNGGSGHSHGGSTSPGGSSTGTASGGRVAVSFAYAQLGKWYLWAAAGPNRFDCSGLTMRAWERAGVYLPHYSVAQYQVTQHVSISSMRPGDLIFYASNTSDPGSIHHVAIYIGGGRMIEAAHAGTQVRIASIWRSGMMPYAGRP